MDASFEPTFTGGSGWDDGGGFSSAGQVHASNAFDRVPVPVQINELLASRSDDDKIHFGGYAFGTLRICGRVVSKDEQDKQTQIELCDPSETDTDFCDRLKVIVYQSAQKVSDYNVNDIIIALGKVRKFDGAFSFVAFGVTPVVDPRLAEAFALEAQLAKYFYSINVPERICLGQGQEYEGTVFSNTPIIRENKGTAAQPAGIPGQMQTANAPNNYNPGANYMPQQSRSENRGLTGTREKILTAVRSLSANGEIGTHVNDILRTIGSNVPSFNSDLQYLVNEGVLYNTIDDDHFAAV